MGKTIEVDTDEGGSAVGKFLRIKICYDIRKPLMRGVTMEVGPNGKTQWCPLQYEFLPNFCYICGLLGHVDRECPMGSWKEKKKPFGPELRVLPSCQHGLEEFRSRNSRSTGSGGPKSEGNSVIPGRTGCIGGSVSVSEKTVKGSAQLGDETMIPVLHFAQPADAKKLVLIKDTEERDGHKATEEERHVGEKESGQLVEKELLIAEQRVGSNKDDCTYEDRNDIMSITEMSTAQSGDTFAKVQEMEIDAIGLTVPHNQNKEEDDQEKACKNNKNQRTVRKVKRAHQEILEVVNHNHVKKRNCESLGEGEQGLK